MIQLLSCLLFATLISGCSPSPSTNNIEAAVRSHDAGAITRAFHDAIYDRSADMEAVLPAVRRFLDDPSPLVRIRAAEALYTAGDRSGYSALTALPQAH